MSRVRGTLARRLWLAGPKFPFDDLKDKDEPLVYFRWHAGLVLALARASYCDLILPPIGDSTGTEE